jgi:hypothetical protein
VAAYALCSVLAAFNAASRRGWGVLSVMPVVFACYHFGYGTGFLVGIRDFIIVRRGAPNFAKRTTRTT